MNLIKLEKLFDVKYGNKFDANKMIFSKEGDINFISRDSKNNGCVGTVIKYKGIEPFNEGSITVSLGGSFLLSSFIQPRKFYTAQNVAVLIPRKPMSLNEKMFYCKCISMNRFKYSAFGREANKTLKYLEIPGMVPDWVNESTFRGTNDLKEAAHPQQISLKDREFKLFTYSDLFDIKKGKRIVASKLSTRGNCPLVSSIDKNNGISDMLDVKPNHEGNTITVNYNGSIGEAFYQKNPYWATDDVNVLYPKFELNVFIAMFLITLIMKEKYRFNFGRKWYKERMENSTIKLPVNMESKPDWDFMENYIKSLPYTRNLAK